MKSCSLQTTSALIALCHPASISHNERALLQASELSSVSLRLANVHARAGQVTSAVRNIMRPLSQPGGLVYGATLSGLPRSVLLLRLLQGLRRRLPHMLVGVGGRPLVQRRGARIAAPARGQRL